MKQSDLLAVVANQSRVDPAPDADSATTTSINMPVAPAPAPTTGTALSGAVWKPTFKEFLYAHPLASKFTNQT
jgi:hypothetical protein